MIASSRLRCASRGNQGFPRMVPGNMTEIDDNSRRGVQYLVAVAVVFIAKV